MTEEGHIARRRAARLLLIAAAWGAAMGGFAVYLASLGSFMEAYGGVGIGLLLVLWLTLFSVLYYAIPNLPGAARRPIADIPIHAAAIPPSPIVERVDLVVTPSAALRNTTAQGRMMSILGARASALSEREVDIMDWGFAFGVAWAVARHQDPDAPEALVSERALDVTQAVYEAYRGNLAPEVTNATGRSVERDAADSMATSEPGTGRIPL